MSGHELFGSVESSLCVQTLILIANLILTLNAMLFFNLECTK